MFLHPVVDRVLKIFTLSFCGWVQALRTSLGQITESQHSVFTRSQQWFRLLSIGSLQPIEYGILTNAVTKTVYTDSVYHGISRYNTNTKYY